MEEKITKKSYILLPFLLSSIFINYYLIATLNFNDETRSQENFQAKPAGPLGNNSILFDGMYYNWSGYFSYYSSNWAGNVTYTHYAGNTFNVSEYNNLMGGTIYYNINNQTRITTGGVFGSGSTPYWIFTNISISDNIPIVIGGMGDINFQVTAIQKITHKGTEYNCFILNYSTSWAFYEVNTGILIDSYFVWMSPYYYTMGLDATNAPFSTLPLNILSPGNQSYHYSQIPIVVQNKTSFDEVWFRNSTNGGIDWSANYSLGYDGNFYSNTTDLSWEDGIYMLQVFANTTEGNVSFAEVQFTVDTYGPWIELLSPQNSTYCARTPTIQLDVIVHNYTETDSVWYRYNAGSAWTQNSSLTWNGAEFLASVEFPSGHIHLQVFANDTLNHISFISLWLRYTLAGNAILFDGMYYNWTGEYSGLGTWAGNVTYTYNSGSIFNVNETNTLVTIPSYTVNNETRITSGGIYGAGTCTPYWIFNNVSISDYIPIALDGMGNVNFQVTDIVPLNYKITEIECFVLNYSTSWAYYEINTGLLIQSHFEYMSGYYYSINLNATNVGIPPKPIKLLNPVNKTYYYSEFPIVMKNATTIQNAWYRNSTNGGVDWSADYPLLYNGTYFVNASDIVWEDGTHILQVYANTSTGRVVQESVCFTVDTYGPWIEFINPQNTTYTGTNLTISLDIVVENFTYAHSVWFRYNSGSGWSENYTLAWNTTYFVTSARFSKGEYHLQIFGNNSLNQIAKRDLWFTYVEYKHPWNYIMTAGYAYAWEDATTGTRCNMDGLDDQTENFNLPFAFNFYNESYTSIYVCTNGFLSFNPNTEWNSVPFPTSIYPHMIAPFWADLKANNPCNIFVQNLTSPNRVVIEWQNMLSHSGNLVGSFEAILYESGDIVFNYDFLSFIPKFTCGLNFGEDVRFYSQYTQLNNSINDFSLLFSYPPNNFLPNLTNPLLNPATGNQSTLFSFNVTYADQDNNYPQYIQVVINGTPFDLEKIDVGDFNYIDGCDYSYSLYLLPGNYEYYFICCDGNYIYETSTTSLYVLKTNLYSPQLTNSQVNPPEGDTELTSFQFTVNYTDPDNNNPVLINLVLNGCIYSLSKQNPADYNYMDGCLYTINLTLARGTYSYYFNCSDGDFLQWTGLYSGPTVTIVNTAPHLTFGSVDPQRGNNATTYQFIVTYTDFENDSPVGGVLIYIDGTPHLMSELNPLDSNYTDGKVYVYVTSLGEGDHQFYFSVTDGSLMATTEVFNGPSVYDLGTQTNPPDYFMLFLIIMLIGAGLIITLETVILLKRRRRIEVLNTKG